jgi:hypothetical protein
LEEEDDPEEGIIVMASVSLEGDPISNVEDERPSPAKGLSGTVGRLCSSVARFSAIIPV